MVALMFNNTRSNIIINMRLNKIQCTVYSVGQWYILPLYHVTPIVTLEAAELT